jgi:hypothetical protein
LSSAAIHPRNSPKYFGLAEIAADQGNATIGDRIDGRQRLHDQFAHRRRRRFSHAAPFATAETEMTRSCRSNTPIYRSPPSSFTANRLGVPKERMITAMIEPDNWLTKARQGARRLVIRAGLGDKDINWMIKQAQKEVEPLLG